MSSAQPPAAALPAAGLPAAARPTVADTTHLRRVFGACPSGVTAIGAVVDGVPVGLAASSFTSVSLDPPLVSVCIARTSSTWPLLARAPRIGISILSAAQAQAGRQLAARQPDRFAGLTWHATADGAVLLADASGWLDTSIEAQIPAGDHDIIVLRVHDLDASHDIHPLVFHASRFHRLEHI
ncbi:flavin reductase family protein [Frankia sp. EI5c]|uniref:flavin reductase family protein n=1 Tax=Frankia sp. EI5c TaxID=683316 RepID=UPI0018FF014D